MQFRNILAQLLQRQDLSIEQMQFAMQAIMNGEVSDSEIAAFLAAMATKGETVTEIIEAVKVMRSLSAKVSYANPEALVDTVGCGDGSSTFNISTCCTFILAFAGVPVAKHGNRSNSSASGSSDVLAAAGVNLHLTPEQVCQCIEQLNIGFLFAPKHHAAMRHAVQARKDLGVRTLFNLLGPLTNPANAGRQVIGLFSEQWLEIVATVLAELGSQHAMIVHARDNLDEISVAAVTDVVEMQQGKLKRWQINPIDFGMHYADLSTIVVDSPEHSLQMMQQVLSGSRAIPAAHDIVALNAAAGLYVGDVVASFVDGVAKAKQIMHSGAGLQRFDDFVALTNSFKD